MTLHECESEFLRQFVQSPKSIRRNSFLLYLLCNSYPTSGCRSPSFCRSPIYSIATIREHTWPLEEGLKGPAVVVYQVSVLRARHLPPTSNLGSSPYHCLWLYASRHMDVLGTCTLYIMPVSGKQNEAGLNLKNNSSLFCFCLAQ